ncbi:MAG: cyclic nucleotide-binding domain-containing protein [Chloroflexi bacterium]|nr:cyclic nucleotide-binding domain-containing protein [Chloroflexota bacterium]MBP8054379.1 cyclic nucleotide-binding domain-containing protein [Chloroflexota bacterium]
MTSKRNFLAQHPLFSELYEDELTVLAAITEEREYPEGAVVAYQRDVADGLYLVRSGHLLALSVTQVGEVASQDKKHYMAGQFFDDAWLFAPGIHPATVKAVKPSRVLTIKGDNFLKFVEKHHIPVEYLGLTPQAQEAALRSRLALPKRQYAPLQLQPDELVEWQARRSPYILLLRGIFPAVLMFVVPLLLFYLFVSFIPTASTLLLILVTAIPALIGAAIMGFHILDWSNDYFLVTNRYLIHAEFNLRTFSTAVDKVPIDRVQSVEIEKPSFLMNLFDVGSAKITTGAQNKTLRFDFIDNPQEIQDTLNRMQQRGKALDFGREQASMRESVEGYFALPPAYKKVEEPKPTRDEEEELPLGQRLWQSIQKETRQRLSLRHEVGNLIIYRKHPLVLLNALKWPFVGFVLLIVFNILANQFALAQTISWLWLLEGPAFLVILFWSIWQFLDWDNDLYQLSDRYVVDIDRLPFGFSESRKQADLGNVQNVSATRPSFLATLFNYGNVKIETAGAAANIIFENVHNPNKIQNEIFGRRDAFQRLQANNARKQQRREYGLLLDVYKQALEQDRIPQRTPIGDMQEYLDDDPQDESSLLNGYNNQPT